MRFIKKGNVNDNECYDIRISEENGKDYYYHVFALADGESIIYSARPFNIRNAEEISWDNLSIKVRDAHYNNMYPNGQNKDFQKNSFIYGLEKANQIKETTERKKEEERLQMEYLMGFSINYYTALAIYNAIGKFNKVNVIFEKYGRKFKGKYLVDDKRFVVVENYEVVSVTEMADEEHKRAEWGKRVGKIAKLAGTSYDLATVVGNVEEIDEAVEILKEVKDVLSKAEFDFSSWIIPSQEQKVKQIRNILYFDIPYQRYKKLNFNRRFFKDAKEILENK